MQPLETCNVQKGDRKTEIAIGNSEVFVCCYNQGIAVECKTFDTLCEAVNYSVWFVDLEPTRQIPA